MCSIIYIYTRGLSQSIVDMAMAMICATGALRLSLGIMVIIPIKFRGPDFVQTMTQPEYTSGLLMCL